jgi:hypothetical protein
MGTVGLALVAAPASAEDSKPKPKTTTTTTTKATWLALPPDPQRDIARNTVSGVPR